MIEVSDQPGNVHVTVEPDTDDGASVYVNAGIISGGQNRGAFVSLDGEPSEDEVANALVGSALAVAQMYSPGTWISLQQRLAKDLT